MRRLSRAGLLVAIALLVLPALGKETGSSAAQSLNARLAGIHSLEAHFRQTTIDGSNRTLQEETGQLWVASPSRFRIETTEPFVQTLVSDGTDFWSWDADLAQVIVRKLDTDIKQVPILLLGGNVSRITSQYAVSDYQDKQGEHYVLQPATPGNLFETLTIAFVSGVPSSIEITDSLGQQTRVELTDVNLNADVDASRFTFTPPDGADVIDDRDAQ